MTELVQREANYFYRASFTPRSQPMFPRRRFPLRLYVVMAAAFLCTALPLAGQIGPIERTAVHHDVSLPLRDMSQNQQSSALPPVVIDQVREAEPARRIPLPTGLKPAGEADPVHQHVAGLAPTLLAPSVGLGFDGLGNGSLGFTVNRDRKSVV